MGRLARVVAVSIPHHVTQRGNNRCQVFYTDADRHLYLRLLRHYCQQYRLNVEAYCLMTNHVHLVVVPQRPDSMARALGRTHNDYSRSLHIQRGESGHLWQNRFFSCPLDGYHLWEAMRYVELNPVRASLVEGAAEWAWSSAKFHVGVAPADGVLDPNLWNAAWTSTRWRDALSGSIRDSESTERIREATRNGRPLGGKAFVEELEHRLQRAVLPQKPGPRRSKGATQSLGIA